MSDAKESLTRLQRGLIIGALAAVLGGLGYWWYTTLEWEEKEIDLGYSKEARQNDFLAAEIFLRKQGVQATTVKNLSLLDKHSWRNLKLGAQDTIVIINGYKTLTQERYDSLYEWVEAGGTLITSTQNPFIGTHTSEEDLLLNDFNIELLPEETDADTRDLLEMLADGFDEEDESDSESADDKNDNKKSDEKASDAKHDKSAEKTVADKSDDKNASDKNTKTKKDEKPENYYRCSLKETPTAVEFADEEKPLNFDFSRRSQFIYYDYVAHDDNKEDTESGETPTDQDLTVDDAQETESVAEEETDAEEDYHYDEKREHLLYFDIGEGSVTITSDNTIWANQRIDCHDHAYGLWRLVNPDGRVWFLINQDAPSLASILWRNASYGVIAGMIALVLWLWALSVRFGPVLVIEQSGRRSLAEHIYASAMLLWRKQQHPQLLNILRKEILERLDEQHPNLDQASGEQRLEFLHQLTGISQADIKQALFADGLHHPQEFAAAIAHLQTIRKQLSGSNYD
ncbi:DUF4350 domain-containing protein [Cellvibrio fibrivorans]|uniref:DUF4350 domain-containing protein n=1 Tax=Cellvibrio fibrivorans TaxID=126350 RepID=A0ABU1USC0_9GAMM|nr:DUF4350 domain-containing protein [Cellvibrio fibrivorans]MDR7088086.1 hypothetical protein [Cellvibrio fibrivorans]